MRHYNIVRTEIDLECRVNLRINRARTMKNLYKIEDIDILYVADQISWNGNKMCVTHYV